MQIPLTFVSDNGIVTARDELVQKCLCLEVRHEPQNVEQALRRMTQRNVPEGLELLEQDGEDFCRALQRQYFTTFGDSFETLDQCAFAAMIATLSAETSLPKGRFGQSLDRSQSRGAQDGGLLVTNSRPTELASKVVAQDDTDELDRMCEDQDERRRADERRTSNAENEVEGELVRGDDHGENRLEANTNEEDVWTLAEEHENIQDDVTFADGAWNENATVFEQKKPLHGVLALDADDAAPNDKVVKEAKAVFVEGEAVDLPEVDVDRKDEATLRDVVTEGVLVPAVGAPQTGWHVDRFPQGPGRMRLVSTPLWSLRPPTCEPELWLIIGKAAQSDEGERYADDRDAFAAQEERCSSWRRAKRGGVVACGVQGPVVDGGGELPGAGSAGDGHACLPCAPVQSN